jgi:hypothetical protein
MTNTPKIKRFIWGDPFIIVADKLIEFRPRYIKRGIVYNVSCE